MKVVRLTYPFNLADNPEPSSVAIGYFDGVHRGHQVVIGEAIQRAKDLGIRSSVMTFDPHPKQMLRKQEYTSYITPLEFL